MKVDPTSIALVSALIAVTVGWLVFSAIVRAIARSEFRRMFKGTLLMRGKSGRFERL